MPRPEGAGDDVATGDAARAFLAQAFETFERACAAAGSRTETVTLAGRAARVRFAGETMHARIAPALVRGLEAAEPALDVAVFDSASTGTPMPPPPWSPEDVRERGEIRGLDPACVRGAFNAGSNLLTLHDRTRDRALVWTPDAREVPYYETASPLRTLWSWWLADAGLQVVHAGAVGDAERGVLLTGRGGSGKTTTALLCVAAGMAYGGDNNLVLDEGDAGAPPRGHALFTSATVRPDTLARVPALREKLVNPDRLDAEKGMLFVDREPDARVLSSFDVACVLLPEVVGAAASRLVPARPAAALAALAPSSVLSLPFARREAFARMARFVRRVPCAHLRLAPDLERIPDLVRDALAGRVPS